MINFEHPVDRARNSRIKMLEKEIFFLEETILTMTNNWETVLKNELQTLEYKIKDLQKELQNEKLVRSSLELEIKNLKDDLAQEKKQLNLFK